MRIFYFLLFQVSLSYGLYGQEASRWTMLHDGSIQWTVNQDIPHHDHIEMSGPRISAVLRYGVEANHDFKFSKTLVWPTLRTIPNNTHASLTRRFEMDGFDLVLANRKPLPPEITTSITLDGTMKVESKAGDDLQLTRQMFPSMKYPDFQEIYIIRNVSGKKYAIEIPEYNTIYTTDSTAGVLGSYQIYIQLRGDGFYTLESGDSVTFSMVYMGWGNENSSTGGDDAEWDLHRRQQFIQETREKLILETPDPILNTAFAFAKIRAAESLFETKGGPMHGPGGEAYYAAIWANDQAEYIGPFFPFLGYDYGNAASLNAYMHFARYMNDAYEPIPSSIIAEGTDIWNGAGDRGDAAMIAYGAARYALARGDTAEAAQLWPLITWCLEYCRRQLNDNGVVQSDSDELEGRLPAGDANLCTSSLYYDALRSAVALGNALGKDRKVLKAYAAEADEMKKAIEKFFGAEVQGFHTYRYYEGNDVLRAWICIPLTMGIFDRSQGTIDALFSPQLWTEDGLASVAGDVIFWDRSTLYGLRGVLAAGETERALKYLQAYSTRRLLGEHIPYPVEAYPEGSQRHLSAESGLYCRVFTEGLFGIRPVGLQSFELTPRLPAAWPSMALRNIHAFGQKFDLLVAREDETLKVTIIKENEAKMEKKMPEGETILITIK
jgi:hypothetical protein